MTFIVKAKSLYISENDTMYTMVRCPINPDHRLTPLATTEWTTRWVCEDCGLEFVVDYTPEEQTA